MKFRNEYNYLSNMYSSPIKLNGLVFGSAEAAFQAYKCTNLKDVEHIATLSGVEAKRYGRKVELKPDWNTFRLTAMKHVVRQKFIQNPHLAAKLLATTEHIQEDNTWNDTFWGVCNGRGQNHLGKILMDVRDSLRK